MGQYPCGSALQMNIKAIREETWEAIHQQILDYARQAKVETGRKVRIDATAVETDIHHPTDVDAAGRWRADHHRCWPKARLCPPSLAMRTAIIGAWSRSGC